MIEFCYAGIAALFVFLFHKEVFVQWTPAWIFALAAISLGSAQAVDLILIQGMNTPASVDVAFCQGFIKAVAYSLKLAGCASLLGALMETLLAKRRMQSVERMLWYKIAGTLLYASCDWIGIMSEAVSGLAEEQ